MRNFGHNGPEKFDGLGINGKNSEFHAAMGIVNLKYVNHILLKRKSDSDRYDYWLNQLKLQKPKINKNSLYNFAYFPVVFNTEQDCLLVKNALEQQRVFPRRYFYPVLSELNYVSNQKMPIANSISERILCLPLYEQLSFQEIDMVCRIILRTLKN
jgi:dTDP-4-amino-4,6-dideoxygalactose transaminase